MMKRAERHVSELFMSGSGLRAQGSGLVAVPQSPEPRARSVVQKGQSTLEYILVLSAILVALIAIVGTTIHPAVQQTMTDSQSTITAATAKVQTGLGL